MDKSDVLAELENVVDADTFLRFLVAMLKDLRLSQRAELVVPSHPTAQAARGWENNELGSFLEAAIAGGAANRVGQGDAMQTAQRAWRASAEIIYCGKIYE